MNLKNIFNAAVLDQSGSMAGSLSPATLDALQKISAAPGNFIAPEGTVRTGTTQPAVINSVTASAVVTVVTSSKAFAKKQDFVVGERIIAPPTAKWRK